jgi:hypothetical protein
MKIGVFCVAGAAAGVSNELSAFCVNRCLVKLVDNRFITELFSATSGCSFENLRGYGVMRW